MCLCEDEDRGGGASWKEAVRLIWIQALAPRGPVHRGPPTRHCNFISCRGDNERRAASTYQTPRPPIPTRPPPRTYTAHTLKEHKGSQLCTCMRKHGNPLTHFSHSLSHVPTLFPPSSAPPWLFFPTGRSLVGRGSRISSGAFPAFPVLEQQGWEGGHGGGRGAETIGSALIYGASFDGLSLLLTINS